MDLAQIKEPLDYGPHFKTHVKDYKKTTVVIYIKKTIMYYIYSISKDEVHRALDEAALEVVEAFVLIQGTYYVRILLCYVRILLFYKRN